MSLEGRPFQTISRRPRLLLVDDDPVNLAMVASIFEEDHEVTTASAAAEALSLCQKTPPDLVLMDILMPEMDGLEACRRLKQDPATEDIPVIFITSEGTPEEETEALEVGAVDFIAKPVNPTVVRARVHTHLTLKAQSDFLRSLAFLDGLTGVPNRRRFDELLETEWRRCRRNQAPLTLIMIDIDQFKHFNDTYGHQAGDACLRSVARALDSTFKRAHDFTARYGGEEFGCILPETGLEDARPLAESLRAAVQDLAIPHQGTGPGVVTISLGLATMVPNAEAESRDLLAQADSHLYAAKERGRNRVEC